MKFIMIFIAALAVASGTLATTTPAFAQTDGMQLILSLQTKSDDKVVSRIDLYANDIDPNSSSVDDKYRFEIDGKEVKIPLRVLSRLDHGRRDYSYDNFTGGLKAWSRDFVCRMGGPARGQVLYVRYLNYKEYNIESSEMKPVYSHGNCLFTEFYSPVNADATAAASSAATTLELIREMLGGKDE